MPPHATLSPDVMREALSNLLDNARRHAATQIVVEADARDGAIEISVRDDGGGVPWGTGEHIFEPFVSLDGRGGSGLGLPIARGLARQEGGEAWLANGAFTLRLPMMRRDGVKESSA